MLQTEPFRDPADRARASGTGGSLQGIYVSVSRCHAGEDCASGKPGASQRPDRRSGRHAAPDCQQMALSLLGRAAARPARATPGWATSPLFPPDAVVAIKALACELPSVVACPWRIGLLLICVRRRWRAALSRKSAAPRCGVGLARTHCALGAIAVGSSPATRSLPARPARSSISISVAGKVQRWGRGITCSASTRRPASRRDGGNIRRCRRHPGARPMSSTNMCVSVPWPISLHGMCIGPDCSGAASKGIALPRSIAWSVRSWGRSLTGRHAACSWSTTARATAADAPPTVFAPNGRTLYGSHADPCELAQPTRGVLLCRPAEAAHAEHL